MPGQWFLEGQEARSLVVRRLSHGPHHHRAHGQKRSKRASSTVRAHQMLEREDLMEFLDPFATMLLLGGGFLTWCWIFRDYFR
jgi:hypothetical protein